MVDKVLTEADETEEELIPVDTPPAEQGADEGTTEEPEDGDDEDGDEDARLGENEEDTEADAASSTNRERRRKRREIQRKARDAAQRELEELRRTVAVLSQRVAQTESQTAQSAAANLSSAIDQRLAQAQRDMQQAETIMARATEAGNGDDVVAAMRIRDAARDEAQRLQAAKQQAQQAHQQAQQPQVDPQVVNYAREWMQANPWYDHAGNDRDSMLTKAIDAELVKEGYNPASRVYWEELTSRVADALGSADDGSQTPPATPRRKAPPTGQTREHAPASTRKEIYVTPERKQAMIDAGIWDDPVARNKMLKAYQAYDSGSGR